MSRPHGSRFGVNLAERKLPLAGGRVIANAPDLTSFTQSPGDLALTPGDAAVTCYRVDHLIPVRGTWPGGVAVDRSLWRIELAGQLRPRGGAIHWCHGSRERNPEWGFVDREVEIWMTRV